MAAQKPWHKFGASLLGGENPSGIVAEHEAQMTAPAAFLERARYTVLLTLCAVILGLVPPAQAQSPPAASGGTLRAFGNEPGWRLVIEGGRMALDADYGATKLDAAVPEPVPVPGGRAYAGDAGRRPLRVTVREEICHDTMTGMPRPFTVKVEFDGRALDGCGGEPASLLRGAWVVESVGGEPALQDAKPTITFEDGGAVSGSASCNSYSGSYALTGEGLTVSGLLSTMKACPPPLMQQEDAFLAILRDLMRFERPPDGALVLHSVAGRTIRARRGD